MFNPYILGCSQYFLSVDSTQKNYFKGHYQTDVNTSRHTFQHFQTKSCSLAPMNVFLGGAAIKSSEEIGLEKDLPENFVETSVPTMYAAIQKLCTFVRKYS